MSKTQTQIPPTPNRQTSQWTVRNYIFILFDSLQIINKYITNCFFSLTVSLHHSSYGGPGRSIIDCIEIPPS